MLPYNCNLMNMFRFISAIAGNSHTRKIEEGKDLSMNCNVTLTSGVSIFWKKNGTENILQVGLNLTLPSITTKDSGDYICYSYNSSYETEANGTMVEHYTVDVQRKL